jgi:hypothetical protein
MILSRMLVTIACLMLCSCAGFRRGVESRVSGEMARADDIELDRRGDFRGWGQYGDKLTLPGVSLVFDLENAIQTDDSYWFGIGIPLIPLKWNPRNRELHYRDADYAVQIEVKPASAGYEFFYSRVRLMVDGEAFSPTGGSAKLYKHASYDEIPETLSLTQAGTAWKLRLYFDRATPRPDQPISLDLTEALISEAVPPIPPIVFKKGSWSRRYE